MHGKSLLVVLASVYLSGCVASDPDKYFVGQRGDEKLYEFGAPRHAAIGGERAYKHQVNNFAKSICPQGYRIVSEKYNGTYIVMGQRQTTHYLITISCPA